ncbi:MAG: sulfite exporter TauE/SafE family protein [Desulfobulbaceae bacterium]|nr:sulfite exporter TauE/SafE family protein [Desulfobulbaceae bacterium]
MITEPWIALPAGIIIATVVSSIGLGGGVLWMPLFLILLKMAPGTAVVTSLLIQTAGMGSSSYAYARQKCVDPKLAMFFLIIALPGLVVGAKFAHRLNQAQMEMILGLLVMATALWFVSSNQKYAVKGRVRIELRKSCRYAWLVALMAVGSGMLSVSMGEWLVPIMRGKLAMRMQSAIGTSIIIIFGTCIGGSAAHLLMGGRAELAVVLWAVPGVIIGGQIGPRITSRINERLLKEIFIFLLTLLGIHLIYNAY